MQADMPVKISQNQLDGKIDLILYNPTVERVKAEDPEKEKKGKIQLTMPLDSALKLLRDKQNNVKLKIPISGDISHPEFSVADAINRVLAKTFQKSALSYLKFMLGPYGIGIAAAEQLVGDSSIIRLNPIPFAPGNAELDEAAIDYLERVAAILKEHPAAQLVVCGVATESDRGALSESPSTEAGAQPRAQKENNLDKENTTDTGLLELAKNRTERIKGQLVKSHGIAAKRIVACKPKIDEDAVQFARIFSSFFKRNSFTMYR
jgi:outer membrane protein OmpA-like peptidoglycan-associated protein